MDINEAIATADEIVFAYSGQHLSDLEQVVLKGCLQRLKYEQIADETSQSDQYIKDIGALLWRKVSAALNGEKVKKSNIHAVLERYRFNQSNPVRTVSQTTAIDLGNAPDAPIFFGRQEELTTLRKWILAEQCKLVAIIGMRGIGKTSITVRLGMGGIGKTDLTLKLVQGVQSQFDFVIWRSLLDAPPLTEILQDWIQFLSHQQVSDLPDRTDQQILKILPYLRTHRCLLILDNLESILNGKQSSQLMPDSPAKPQSEQAGQYRVGYEGYGQLLQAIGAGRHKSCLLINSREKPKTIENLTLPSQAVRLLRLEGLDETSGERILTELGVNTNSSNRVRELVAFYNGNPLALQLVASHIQLSYLGDLDGFSAHGKRLFSDIHELLDWHFERLSATELEIMYWLAINREAVSISILQADLLSLDSKAQVADTLKFLQRRIPIERSALGFKLQPVLIEYLTERLIDQICLELESGSLALFKQYALIKATAKDFVRQAQVRLILKPIAEKLLTLYSQPQFEDRVREILAILRFQGHGQQGYAAGNILNLLRYVGSELSGWDFSQLAIWQAYVQGQSLTRVNFSNCNFYHSVFTQAFGGIHSVAFSPDGKLLAAGDSLGEISIFRLSDTQKIRTLRGNYIESDWVPGLAFSPAGEKLFSCSFDQTIKIWCVASGEHLQTLHGHENWIQSVTVSPDGKMLGSAGDDQTIRLWDADSGECLRILEGHTARIWAVTFSPDGEWLASGSYDTTIRLWNPHSGECVKVLNGHQSSIQALAFSPDSDLLVSGSIDCTIKVWAVSQGQCRQTLRGHLRGIDSVTWRPQQNQIVSGSFDKTIKLWDIDTGHCIKTLQGNLDGDIVVAFSPDGKILASGNNYQELKLWDVDQGYCYKSLRGYSNWIWSISWRPATRVVASAGVDGVVRFWDLNRGNCFSRLSGHSSWIWLVEFSADGRILASAGDDGTIILWDAKGGEKLNILRGSSKVGIWSASFSPDGKMLASGGQDGTLRLWDVQRGVLLKTIEAHSSWIWSVRFSPDGALLASGGHDGLIKLWNVDTGECNTTFSGDHSKIFAVAFHPTEPVLVGGTDNQSIGVWHTYSLNCIDRLSSELTPWVMAIAFSPDGELLASGGNGDGRVCIHHFRSNQNLTILQGHTGTVRSILFSPTGEEIITSGTDETIRVWDVGSGHCKQILRNPRPYDGMNIQGASGLGEAQINTLKFLGAQG